MSVVASSELKSLLEGGLVEGMIDPETQVQMCGVELTLQRIEMFSSCGSLDYDNSERRVADLSPVPFDPDGWAFLEAGCYIITFNEVVSIPSNTTAFARPRSSLLRSGAALQTALWDPGYRGRSQSLLVVHNPHGLRLKRNARVMQLVFLHLSMEAHRTYSGIYQGENL